MSELLAIAILFLAAFALSVLWRVRPEETLPFAVFFTIVFLYAFYCFDLLPIGKWTLRAGFFTVAVLLAVVVRKRKAKLAALVPMCFTPGICLLLGLSVVFFLYTRGSKVGLWDELRLWGAVPKALHMTERLQLGPDAALFTTMQSYPPGMPLFLYYLTGFSSTFSESTLFFGYAFFGAMLFLPALSKLTWKQWPLFAPILLVIIVLPTLFTDTGGDFDYYYNSLFIDAPLGLLIGYVLYAVTRQPWRSRFQTASCSLAACALVLLKDSGALFAFVIFAGAFLYALFFDRDDAALPRGRRILRAAVPILAALLCFAAWQILLVRFGVKNHVL